jgi:hypothetical protein
MFRSRTITAPDFASSTTSPFATKATRPPPAATFSSLNLLMLTAKAGMLATRRSRTTAE